MARVSVITPAHDSASTLAETIASVRAQGFRDWEMIVVDDASHDDTVALVERVSDPRVHLVRSDVNRGPAGARNLALDHASGELVALLDADDRWLPSYLERQVARFDRERGTPPPVGIVCCDAHLERAGVHLPGTFRARFGPAEGIDVEGLLRTNPIFISALLPRAVVEEVGRFSTECWGSEDHDLWLRIREAGYRVVATDEPLAIYRMASGSVSDSALQMARTDQATFRRALARGRLTPAERRVASRRLRVARAAEAVALASHGRPGQRAVGLVRAVPLAARAAVSDPGAGLRWLRRQAAAG